MKNNNSMGKNHADEGYGGMQATATSSADFAPTGIH
jgi:hypothetical protein